MEIKRLFFTVHYTNFGDTAHTHNIRMDGWTDDNVTDYDCMTDHSEQRPIGLGVRVVRQCNDSIRDVYIGHYVRVHTKMYASVVNAYSRCSQRIYSHPPDSIKNTHSAPMLTANSSVLH